MILHEIVALAPHARTVTVVAVTKADSPACAPRFAGMHDPGIWIAGTVEQVSEGLLFVSTRKKD